MSTTLKAGDSVRLKVSEHRRVGTVTSVSDGMVAVRYEHTPDKITNGYYPVSHVELVNDSTEASATQANRPTVPTVKATTADIIGGAK